MSVESLESLLRLSTVRALTGAPLLQILLVGLPTLWHHFSAPPLRPFKQRTVTRVTLAPLTYGESLAYIRQRLRQAGAGEGAVFAPGAMRRVARHARGNPRVMDMLCTNMLLTGFLAQQKPIAAHIARDVITTYRTKSSHPRWWCGVTAAASILAVAAMVGPFPSTYRMVAEQSPRSFLPLTRGLRTGSSVETAQQPAQTGSSPSVSPQSALPPSVEVISSLTAPTEPPPLSMQVVILPETPALQTPPPTSPATVSIPLAARHPGLPLEIATASPPPAVSEQPVAPQALREVARSSKAAPSLRTTPIPSMITTRITSPQHGATVAQKIAVEGVIAGLQPDQHVFLCVQSQAFGRRIYPQGKVRPDARGQWKVESIYGTSGYKYETYLVITTNTAAAAMLHAQQSRKYGMRDLPPSTERLGTSIVVMRE